MLASFVTLLQVVLSTERWIEVVIVMLTEHCSMNAAQLPHRSTPHYNWKSLFVWRLQVLHTYILHTHTYAHHRDIPMSHYLNTCAPRWASDSTFVRVMRRPLMEVTTMIPTRRKDTYWAQNSTYREMEAGLSKMWRYVYCNDG